MSLLFQQERIEACWDEALAIVAANHEETGYKSVSAFRPLRDWYVKMEREGGTRLFTMRHDGELTGYQVFLVYRDPDYEFQLAAIQRTLYMVPAHRGILGFLALRFMRFADAELTAQGIVHITRQERTGGPRYARLLEHEGYEEVERVFMKKVT